MIDYKDVIFQLWRNWNNDDVVTIVCDYCKRHDEIETRCCDACAFNENPKLVLKAVREWYNSLEKK